LPTVSGDRAAAETREYGRSAAGLTLALGAGGVLTYVFFAISSRSLTPTEYGEIVVLWSVVFLLASTLFRPIEQLLARTLAERKQVGATSDDALRSAAIIQAGIVATLTIALLIAKGPIEENLFEDNPGLYWAMIVSLLGFGLAFYVRGFLAGRGQFPLYAALVLLEVVFRLAFAVVVAIGLAEGPGLIAVGIAAAPIAALVVLPMAFRKGAQSDEHPEENPIAGEHELSLGSGGAFAAAVLLMMLSEQVLVSSGALFVRAAEGAAAAGFIFNVLLIARAPLVLFQAVAASLLPHLTKLRARGDETAEEAFRHSLVNTMLLIAGFAAIVTVGVLAIGPQVMQLAFGDQFEYDRLGLAIVSIGMGFYLVAASLNQAVLAQGQARRAAVPWVFCALAFVAYNLIAPGGDAFRAVEVGFAGAAVLLSVLLYLVYSRPHPSAEDSLEPGSGREVEARLAAFDEVG
jgi:O-antigen/teichoic acid export membrane protein